MDSICSFLLGEMGDCSFNCSVVREGPAEGVTE